jgi:hypothetical protein
MFLVILQMTAREALEEFTRFVIEVFNDEMHDPMERTKKLKRMIFLILEKYGIDKERTLIPSSGPAPRSRL